MPRNLRTRGASLPAESIGDAPANPPGDFGDAKQRVFRRPGTALAPVPMGLVNTGNFCPEHGFCPEYGAAMVQADPVEDGGEPAACRPLHRWWRPGWSDEPLCPPMARESWLRRPFSITWFMGMVQGSPLITDWVDEERGLLGGVKVGWDFDNYWGTEMRLAYGSAAVHDSQRAIAAQIYADDQARLPLNDPLRRRFDGGRNAQLFLWDLDVLYYPWGDTAWRPYLSFGLGTAQVNFSDRLSRSYANALFAMPLAVGLKYHCHNAVALRLECADNVALGAHGIDTLHQLSLVGGLELRVGGSRKAYWPWNPARNYW